MRYALSLLLPFLLLDSTAILAPAMSIPESHKIGGFAVGTQAYTFRAFTAMEAIEKTAEAGGRVIEFYPGQPFSPEQRNLRWDHHATEEMIIAIEDHLRRFDLLAVNYGVVGIANDEEDARRVFDFARRLGVQAITTNSVESIDLIESLVREYDIRVAFHNHPRNENRPDYRLWDPNFLAELLDGRDERIGACADTGHWIRSGINPLDALQLLRGRVVSLHLKDRARPEDHDVVFGTGMGNVGGVLEELRSQGFDGHLSVEYEHNWENSVPDVAQCIGFIRGYATARGWE